MLVRRDDGVMLSVPWRWTDLPVPHADEHHVDEGLITLLSPTALKDLVRLVRRHRQQEGVRARSPIEALPIDVRGVLSQRAS